MTKKDYELIAKGIKDSVEYHKANLAGAPSFTQLPEALNHVYTVATAIAVQLINENPKFDFGKFLLACGFDENQR